MGLHRIGATVVLVAAALHATASQAAPVAAKPAPRPPGRLNVAVRAFGDIVAGNVGFEVGAGTPLGAYLDVGLSANLGRFVGGRLLVAVHPDRTRFGVVTPFLQGRGVIHPVATGRAVGGGAFLGGSVEVGPGRAVGALGFELYLSPRGFFPYAVMALVGYEVDFFRPGARSSQPERPRPPHATANGGVEP